MFNSLSWSVPLDVRHKCMMALRERDPNALDRVLMLHAAALLDVSGNSSLARGLISDSISAKQRMYEVLRVSFPECMWYNEEMDIALLEEPLSTSVECTLCAGMEWDEAIYCPQCFGEGYFLETKDFVKLTIDAVVVSNNVRDS